MAGTVDGTTTSGGRPFASVTSCIQADRLRPPTLLSALKRRAEGAGANLCAEVFPGGAYELHRSPARQPAKQDYPLTVAHCAACAGRSHSESQRATASHSEPQRATASHSEPQRATARSQRGHSEVTNARWTAPCGCRFQLPGTLPHRVSACTCLQHQHTRRKGAKDAKKSNNKKCTTCCCFSLRSFASLRLCVEVLF